MSEETVLIRDRFSGVLRRRRADEPIKLRLCRDCGRVHVSAVTPCLAAA